MQERRQFFRFLFEASATLTQQETIWPTQIYDLSLNGALVSKPEGMIVTSQPLTLDFSLNDSEINITMQVKVVHERNTLLGLACEHIDIDSISHLRRIIELNMGDTSKWDNELNAFIEIHDKEPAA
ncbi:PilZ domain-containing protein [Shewanella sp. AS1]|nr:PilZ domain-containing protein [Shewanella sp. AS1]